MARKGILVLSISIIYIGFVLITSPPERHLSTDKTSETTVHNSNEEVPGSNTSTFKPLNILALGGSVTWGAMIDKTKAFPYLLQNHGHNVVDLAIRAAGSAYPAQCITSMLREKGYGVSNDDKPFDVILLEFSINGHEYFDTLVLRLKERFPDALMIYIDLYSIRVNGNFDTSDAAKNLVRENGGIVYSFPRVDLDDTKQIELLFAEDRHHISEEGHVVVMKGINAIIERHGPKETKRMKAKVGSWLGGDICNNWMESNDIGNLRYSGDAELSTFDRAKHKHALEIKNGGGILMYTHEGVQDALISFSYMTKCLDPDSNDSIYPPVIVKIEQSKMDITIAVEAYSAGEVKVKILNFGQYVAYITEGWTYISSIFRKKNRRKYHIMETQSVGTVKKGHNYMYIQPLKEGYPEPFRLVGTIICEACSRFHGSHPKASDDDPFHGNAGINSFWE